MAQFNHESVRRCSRAVRSRLRSSLANKEWANSAVGSLNEIYGRGVDAPSRPSAAQEESLSRIRASFSSMPKAECMDSAAAFSVLCGGLATPLTAGALGPATPASIRQGARC